MIDRAALLFGLQKVMKTEKKDKENKSLEADLLERSDSAEVPDVGLKLRQEFEQARQAERTAQNFEDWRSDAITQMAAAWVLSCVFVRFLEDNSLIDPPRIAGPGDRLKRARDEHELYFKAHPTFTDRDYLLAIFDGMKSYAATQELFGAHNPIRDLPNWLSGDAAGTLIGFFQKVDANTGALVHDFYDPTWDTRFLGDLYQDLSEAARKKYALLQTPIFVEEFILDRTLDPAIEEFGLAKLGYESRLLSDGRLHPDDRFKMIDPACGSGHFLLGSFARLVDRWRKREPGTKPALLVQRALDGVHGVDLNPFAIAIARFRLLLAALKECGVTRLKDAPAFEIHLACGDSLLHGSAGGDQATMGWSTIDHAYQPEDAEALAKLLQPKRYHAVVANPPYPPPKDRALRDAYRDRFSSCHGKYSLAVPFLERIVSLATDSGFTGQITANSFMKREFGKKLIEEFFPRVDLTHVIDTSGAYIPGHGTPTVILFARNRAPLASTLRTVMGIRGEPSTPDAPAHGLVWSAIVGMIDQPARPLTVETESPPASDGRPPAASGAHTQFVSVGDSLRSVFHAHPWSIGGGGAAELKEGLDENAQGALFTVADEIGVFGMTNADDTMLAPRLALIRRCVEKIAFRRLAMGNEIRDWAIGGSDCAIFPYVEAGLIEIETIAGVERWLWPSRTILGTRATFSGLTYAHEGRPWWEWHQVALRRLHPPLSITFAEVATHNHFVLDRGGKVFNQTAPVIKLPADASEKDYLTLLGILNSSTVCFWLKQVCHNKGSTVDKMGARQRTDPFEDFYAFNATKLQSAPLPGYRPMRLPIELDDLAARLASNSPDTVLRQRLARDCAALVAPRARLSVESRSWNEVRDEMIALQEELDWQCYRLYGLLTDAVEHPQPPPLALGQRAFEIVLARKVASGETQTTWFERHGSTPITELPADWPDDYRKLVERRIAIIESDTNIRLIEQPEYKRRWNTEPWESQLERALREWLLDRLESYFDFDGRMNDEHKPTARLDIALTSIGKLADIARQDPDFLQVGELYRDDPSFDVTRLVTELVEAESVPLLPILRYKPSGLRKREEWETTWALQRQEDLVSSQQFAFSDQLKHSKDDAEKAKIQTQIEILNAESRKLSASIPVPPKYITADFLKTDFWRLRGKLDVPKERWVSFPHCQGEDGSLMIAWAGYNHLQLAKATSAHYVDIQERLGGREDPRLIPLLACLIELLPWLKQWHNDVDPEFGLAMGDYFDGFVQEEARNAGLTVEGIRAWQPPERTTRAKASKAAGANGRKRKTKEESLEE